MRIAQIAPLHEAVPPKLYGGTERVVSYLTEELVALGHQVTLFASGDSVTSACLHSVCPRSLRLDPAMRDVIAPHMLMMEEVRRRAEDFDVLHFHLDYWPFSIFTRQKVPFVTTLHGRLDLPELKPIFNAFRDVPVVSISDSQRLALPQAGFVATVPHGVPDMRLSSSTMKPVSLSSITSGTEPRLCDHRCATAHCFDHHQAEWLRPVDRHQQANGAGEEGRFLAVADLPDHLNAWTIQHRPYYRIEVVLVGLVYLSGDP